jgi:hypothetical protein
MLESLRFIAGGDHLVTLGRERFLERKPQLWVVLDDEHDRRS